VGISFTTATATPAVKGPRNPALTGTAQNLGMGNAVSRNDYLRLLYEQAAQEQRQLAERVRAARGHGALIADFEGRAAKLERLARPLSAVD